MTADLHPDTVFFWTGPFSQWQDCRIELDGYEFASAEQAMMHAKAVLFDDPAIAAQILAALDPGKQKALGRQVKGFAEDVWAAHRVQIVTRINLAKFDQNKGLRRKLLQTLGQSLVEASPLDTIWGIGLDGDTARQTPRADWPGQNLLGHILEDVRATLAARYPDEASAVSKDAVL